MVRTAFLTPILALTYDGTAFNNQIAARAPAPFIRPAKTNGKPYMKIKAFLTFAAWLSTILLGSLPIAPAYAQSAASKNEAIFLYKDADRNQKVLEQAKREGSVVWYTSLAPTESTPLAQAFEKKYGVKVEIWRATSEKIVQRVVTEGRAKRHSFDVVETNAPELEMMSRENLLGAFHSPYFADLPSFGVPTHRMWAADRMSVYGVAFNTNLIKREDIPKNYEGFLDPKWKGKIGLEATDGDWMSAVLKAMGNERGMTFMRKLADMRPDMRKGHILLSELVSAGEVPVGLTIYQSNASTLKRRGGPIEWLALDPVVVRPQAIGVAKNAAHPHAALLFADFVLSPEGQTLLESMGRSPVSTKVKSEFSGLKYTMVDPASTLDESEKWQKLWDDLFIKR
jgi:iron(III) transport system substrate-binding protein